MIDIEQMSRSEMEDMLGRVRYGHLGCSRHDHPYVVPIHFAVQDHDIVIYTTEGKKTEMIDANPEVCLQVEEVSDEENWYSVMVFGQAEKLTDAREREKAFEAILSINPSLTPARSVRWVDKWVREKRDIDVIYRIKPTKMTGRRTAGTSD